MKKKLVMVTWIDSKGMTTSWEQIEVLKPSTCVTTGFLIDDINKKYKTLTMAISKGQVFGRITIPTCSIVNYRVIKTSKVIFYVSFDLVAGSVQTQRHL